MSKNHPKWEKMRKELDNDFDNEKLGPIMTPEQNQSLSNNNMFGYSIDTLREYEMQRNNLGPKNSAIELADPNVQQTTRSKSINPEPQKTSSPEPDNDLLWTPPSP